MESTLDKDIKVTIIKNDESINEFYAESDFYNTGEIYTELPIDETSRLIESNYDDDDWVFYSTNLHDLIKNSVGIAISKIK